MDVRKREFLADHLDDPDADNFDLSTIGSEMTATSSGVLRGPAARCDVLARAQPTVLVFVEDQIVMSFAGWVADASRLGAAVDFLRAFPGAGDGAPYRQRWR